MCCKLCFVSNFLKLFCVISAAACTRIILTFTQMQALFSLSSAITSHALTMNATWPFVTIPNSASEFGPYLSLADAAALAVFPIVPRHLRAEWEAYSVANQDWIDNDLQVLYPSTDDLTVETAEDSSAAGNATTTASFASQSSTISPYIKNYVGVDTSPGIWTPWWQYHPVIPNRFFVNFNRLAWKGFPEQLAVVMDGKATLSQTITFVPGLDLQSTKDFTFTNELLQAGGRGRYDAGEPLSYISYPIFDHFGENKEVAGVLVATVYWKSYFQGILADDVEGIICVVTNSDGQSFRYKLNGRNADFLGMDDDVGKENTFRTQYESLRLRAEYSTGLNQVGIGQDSGEDSAVYTGVPVDDEFIVYTLEVYPSQVLEDDYLTNRPIYFSLAIGAVFILCAAIFIIYNQVVDRRQNVVMTTATKSAAVVDSIFPSNVRDRLMEEAPGAKETRQKTAGGAASLLPSALGKGGSSLHSASLVSNADMSDNTKSLPPIADHFEGTNSMMHQNVFFILPEISHILVLPLITIGTTVLFADLKGFTKWCDTREPVHVS